MLISCSDERTKYILLRTISLSHDILDCDDHSFVRHSYLAGLGREPDAGFMTLPPPESNDVYRRRVDYLYSILTSTESLNRGYEAVVDAIPDVLGSRNRAVVVDMIKQVFPPSSDLNASLEILFTQVRENTRRQNMIVASVAGGAGNLGRLEVHS